MTRVIELSGIHNFRDYGDYPTRGGGWVKAGVLFRSGQHRDASVDDLSAVDAIGLATVIDLRGDSERRHYPCARGAGFTAEVLFADGETSGRGGAAHAAARNVNTVDDAEAAMLDLYRFMPNRPNLQSAFRHYFATLADRPGPSLVHCFAGKDRTGLVVALLHRVLGVRDVDIMADYLLTNTAGKAQARIAAGVESIRRTRPDASDAAIAHLMAVRPGWLDAAFATIDAEWGGVDGYLMQALGVDAAQRARIVANLVA